MTTALARNANTELSKNDNAVDDAVIAQLDKVAESSSLLSLEGKSRFRQAVDLATGISQLRASVTPIMPLVMQMQNTSLGFLTDRKEGYPLDVVRECLIEATLRGAYPVGNEWNIISARPYLAKAYFERKVRTFPGLTNLRLRPGVAQTMNGGAMVPYRASWLLDGRPMTLVRELVLSADGKTVRDERIPVRQNAGMGIDAILGKATRKMLANIFAVLSNTDLSTLPEAEIGESITAAYIDLGEGESPTEPTEPATPATDPLAGKLKSAKVVAETTAKPVTEPAPKPASETVKSAQQSAQAPAPTTPVEPARSSSAPFDPPAPEPVDPPATAPTVSPAELDRLRLAISNVGMPDDDVLAVLGLPKAEVCRPDRLELCLRICRLLQLIARLGEGPVEWLKRHRQQQALPQLTPLQVTGLLRAAERDCEKAGVTTA